MSRVREYLRTTLDRLPVLAAEGWKPAHQLPCGAVGLDPFSAGTGAGVTVWREVEDPITANETGEG